MRITFLAWRDPGHPDGGGSEVYVEQVARRLAARGHEVTVRSAGYPGAPSRQVVAGVVHHRSGGRLTVYLRGLAHLLSTGGRRQDVVVDVINGLPFASPLVRRRGVVALVHHLHREQWSIIYPNWKGRLGWFVESRVTPRLYRGVEVVTVSDHTAGDLVGIGIPRGHLHVVRNGLEAGTAVPAVTAATTPPHDDEVPARRLVVLARLVPHKRIEHALAVVARLRHQVPGLHLDVVGDGWWRDELVAEAVRVGVADLVTFHGHVDDVCRDDLLRCADLMLLPSVKEGWGIAVTEAAAQGTPTIGYRQSGGLCESVDDGVTGVLVDDLDGLARATAELLRDHRRRVALSVAAVARARTLDWDDSTTAFEAVVRDVARAPRGE